MIRNEGEELGNNHDCKRKKECVGRRLNSALEVANLKRAGSRNSTGLGTTGHGVIGGLGGRYLRLEESVDLQLSRKDRKRFLGHIVL